MNTFQYVVLPWLIWAGVLVGMVVIYWGNRKTAPVWIQKTAFRIRLLAKWLLYLFALIIFFAAILPLTVQEGVIWLAPEHKFGYAAKYSLPDDKVNVDPKPHDCEWGKAPIGSKYCHFEKVVTTDKDTSGKVTETL